MIVLTDATFERYLDLTKRVSNDVFAEEYIRYFDNDGFELSYLEQEFYRENKVHLSCCLNHTCNQQEWVKVEDPRFKLDHSAILQRWQFCGEAKDQIEKYKARFPQLTKYNKLQPKWGIDFALEFYENDTSLEVLHIELDFHNYYEAVARKQLIEEKLIRTDWNDFVKSLISHKKEWEHLTAMDQNDWKAVHFGLNRAEETFKAFA